MLYTSGSTGRPKGVQITLANLTSFVDWDLSLTRLPGVPTTAVEQPVWLNQAPFSFDLSVMDLYGSLVAWFGYGLAILLLLVAWYIAAPVGPPGFIYEQF